MRRASAIALAMLIAGLIAFWLRREPPDERPSAPASAQPITVAPDIPATNAVATLTPLSTPSGPGATPLLGETILAGYAATNLPPENDLTLMARLMDNSVLLLKSAGNRPLSANEDWADLLRGRNAAQERFLPDAHLALNPLGQLVDRWQTPLFFHALGGGRYELRSAGPDGKLWNDDDLHRNADGSFRRGPELNPESLLQGDLRE